MGESTSINNLIDEHGLVYYAHYCLLLELLTEKISKNSPEVEINLSVISRKVRIVSIKKLTTFLQLLPNFFEISINFCGKVVKIRYPKLLEIHETRGNFKNTSVQSNYTKSALELELELEKRTRKENLDLSVAPKTPKIPKKPNPKKQAQGLQDSTSVKLVDKFNWNQYLVEKYQAGYFKRYGRTPEIYPADRGKLNKFKNLPEEKIRELGELLFYYASEYINPRVSNAQYPLNFFIQDPNAVETIRNNPKVILDPEIQRQQIKEHASMKKTWDEIQEWREENGKNSNGRTIDQNSESESILDKIYGK
jgi:hypothetical protein